SSASPSISTTVGTRSSAALTRKPPIRRRKTEETASSLRPRRLSMRNRKREGRRKGWRGRRRTSSGSKRWSPARSSMRSVVYSSPLCNWRTTETYSWCTRRATRTPTGSPSASSFSPTSACTSDSPARSLGTLTCKASNVVALAACTPRVRMTAGQCQG
ncbi:hypothetical protein Naga_101072g3, partial [Nannochloropsis gaditana]